MRDLNLNSKTVKFLDHDMGENLADLGLGNEFLDRKLKACSM